MNEYEQRVRAMRDEKRAQMIDAVLDAATIAEANTAADAFSEAFPNDSGVFICSEHGGLRIDCPDDCPAERLNASDRT